MKLIWTQTNARITKIKNFSGAVSPLRFFYLRFLCEVQFWINGVEYTNEDIDKQADSRVNCCWPSSKESILVSGLGHIFVLSKTFACFEIAPSVRREERPTTGHSSSIRDYLSGHSLATDGRRFGYYTYGLESTNSLSYTATF